MLWKQFDMCEPFSLKFAVPQACLRRNLWSTLKRLVRLSIY